MADVLDQLSQVIGRPVKPLAPIQKTATEKPVDQSTSRDEAAGSFKGPVSLESVIGRKPETAKLQPLAAARFKMYGQAVKNGFTPDIAAKTAMAEASVLNADPSNWRKIVSSFKDASPTGSSLTFRGLGQEVSDLWDRLNNPLGATNEEWEKTRNDQKAYLDKQLKLFDEAVKKSPTGVKQLGEFTSGATKKLPEFAESFTSPVQLALLFGTFGESTLVRAGAALGIPGAATAARTLSKLMQLNFQAQMVEGTATGLENMVKHAWSGDWESAGGDAVEGLISGVMARGLATHEVAQEKVRGDLEKTARERFGPPIGNPVTAAITSRFNQLDPFHQGMIIHDAVQKYPEYQELLSRTDAQNQKERQKHEQRKTDYHDMAIRQAWEPDTAKRGFQYVKDQLRQKLEKDVSDLQESARQHYLKQVVATLKTATERGTALADEQRQEDEKARQEGREIRPVRKAAEREQKAVVLTNAQQIEGARASAAETRKKADEAQTERTANVQRPVDAQVAPDGHVAYRSNYYGEENTFGVAGDADNLGVYRQTPRGLQYLDKNGLYSEKPQDIYLAPDHAAADTMAKISSLRHTAESEGNAQEESHLAEIERQVASGEKTASEARKELGIPEQIELPTEVDALRAGNLKGPLADRSETEFYGEIMNQANEAGFSPEETEELLKQAGVLARAETENNLHHVGQSGDYITSKKGVRWSLDSQGMLHPDDGGAAVPLMKNGRYTNQALDFARSGSVGYAGRTREQRRVDTARQRAIQARLDTLTEEENDRLRQAQLQLGLEMAPENLPSERQIEKRERASKFGPPTEAAQTKQAVLGIAELVRNALEKTGAAEVVDAIAKDNGVDAEEVIRQKIAKDDSPAGKAASLQVGDKVTDAFRKDRPWVVEESKAGGLQLRSGNANPLPLDRLNPSERVLGLLRNGTLEQERPITDQDVTHVAFDSPHVAYRDGLVEKVLNIANGAETVPEAKSQNQAEAQAVAAERRTDAAVGKATETQADALEPPPGTTEAQAENKVEEAEKSIQLAEKAYSQEAVAKSKTAPNDPFPARAPVTVGLRGDSGVIKQNGRELPMHYEMVPLEALLTSHAWQGNVMVQNADFPSELQPRTISESESKENALRAQPRYTDDNGVSTGYDFAEYADKTINGTMGPAIIEPGGRVVGGNTRLSIMRKHLENLREIQDSIEREVNISLFHDQMRQLARDTGITSPLDDIDYTVVRMLDQPIETLRDAAELGRLLNKSISVQMTEAAKGVSYSKSLTDENLATLGRLIEEHDGITAAVKANPEYFANLVRNNFGIVSSEYANWFESDQTRGLVLNDAGQSQFEQALLGTIFKDTSVLGRVEGTAPYSALTRAINYLIKMRSIPERNITNKLIEAVTASADTRYTDPGLALSKDKWDATYRPDQVEFLGMETERPPEPDRMVEAIWRALNSGPRTFNDRMKNWIGDESAANESMFAVHETPAEVFSRVFRKELKEASYSHKESGEPSISQAEFDSLLRNVELSEEGRKEAKRAEQGKPPKPTKAERAKAKGGLTPPPIEAAKPATPDVKIAEAKAEKGYVTSDDLKTFLSEHPATKEHVNEVMRVARTMAEYVFDADPPEGVDRHGALDWILKERVAKLEVGGKGRGSYSDPLIEKGIGTGILKLTKAADETTFIHEFAHVIFPMLSEQDMRDINSIHDTKIPQWDHDTPLKGEAFKGLSEKFARGLERFLRDENPTGFTAEVKRVLAKVKDLFRKAYMRFAGDPLNTFELSEEARGVFAKMFGLTDFDVPDRWHDEVKKARAESKRLTKPEDEPHPVAKIARDVGATGIRKSFAGKVEDTVGDRVDPKKPTAVLFFPDQATANAAWLEAGTENSKIQNAELISAEDGSYGIRINTTSKVPTDVLYQEIPRKHPGIELEETKKKLAATPASAPMVRRLLELKVQNLENEIRAKYGAEERKPTETKQAAQEALKEKKNASTRVVHELRRLPEGSARADERQGTGKIHELPIVGLPDNAKPRADRGPLPGTRSLAGAKPVNLEPLPGRGEPAGLLPGENFSPNEWVNGNRKAGLPENAPPPTVAISRETAAQLKYAGQKQVVQLAMSALEQGDGFVVATVPGTGKTFTGSGIVKEFLNASPGAKVLVITKNLGLLRNSAKVGKESFGFETNVSVPGKIDKGVYGATYQRLLTNDVYKNTDWDLVIADESGEMRNWFQQENQQGKAGMEVIDKSKKAVYLSATPFHSPAEYGYMKKLNLWPKNGFDKWISENFAHEKIGDKIVAKLDPAKQAKLRQQLIERGQFISQMISYEGFTTHFGVVPVTDETRRSLNRIHEGVSRAKAQLVAAGKKGLADRLSAFEATYTKAFLERSRLPQAIDLIKRGLEQGWHPLVFSETTSEDLFRRPEDGEPGTYRKLDQEMGGELSRIIPPFANVYDELKEAFGGRIADFSGMDNTDAAREAAKQDYLSGRVPALYTTYAAGGIGVSLHDEVGDKPRLAIFLGPPYSGVLLEQAMGRPWRFGVKSNVFSVFLATDSEPDINLMAIKIGPRMRAVRASVLGERDSLGTVMGNYSDDEKLREQQDMLAYDQGNEVKVDAQSFQRRDKRNVNIDNWSAIQIPHADTAKNKGMQIKTAGKDGDWATMYQPKNRFNRPPPTLGEMAAERKIDQIATATVEGNGLSPSEPILQVDPADRETFVGGAAAVASQETTIPVDRDNEAVARMAMERMLLNPATRNNFKWNSRTLGYEYVGTPEEFAEQMAMVKQQEATQGEDHRVLYLPIFTNQEVAIRDIGYQSNSIEAAKNIVRMQQSKAADTESKAAEFVSLALDAFRDAKLNPKDKKLFAEIWDVATGEQVSANEAINKVAESLSSLHEIVHSEAARVGMSVITPDHREVFYGSKEFPSKPGWMPQFHDWNAELEDPLTKKTYTLKEIMGKTFPEKQRERILKEKLAKSKAKVGYEDWLAELKQSKQLRAPVLGHMHRTRNLNFPIIKKDWESLARYYDQAAEAIAIEKNFGHGLKKLNEEIGKIKSDNGKKAITGMFRALLTPEHDSDTFSGRMYNKMTTFEMMSKMTLSATKVPFHVVHAPLALGVKFSPVLKAGSQFLAHPKEFMEHAAYVGTVTREMNPYLLLGDAPFRGLAHNWLRATGFNMFYRWGRALAGASARVYLEQYALKKLKQFDQLRRDAAGPGSSITFKKEDLIRRVVKDNLLIGDHAIDQAIQRGSWAKDDLDKAEVAFANMVMFSEHNPSQMPILFRLNTEHAWLNNAAKMTYALQTFAVKETSFLRQHLFDEVVIHKNFKPLLWAIVAEPILGQLLTAMNSASKAGIQRGMEQATGAKHKKDPWEKYLEIVKDDFDHGALGILRFVVDGAATSLALDRLKRYGDATLDAMMGEQQRARASVSYWKSDEAEEAIGPDWSTLVWQPLTEMAEEFNTEIGHKNPALDQKWHDTQANFWKWMIEEFPILREEPHVMEWSSRKRQSTGGGRLTAPPF